MAQPAGVARRGATRAPAGATVRFLVVALGVALGGALGGVVGTALAPTASGATPDLTMVADARYDVRPDAGKVHVTVDLRATNHRTDTVIRRYFVDHAALAVQPGTTGFKIAAVGSKAHPTVRVSSRTKSQTLLAIGFGTKLRSGRSMTLRVQYDIVDKGGAPDREVRLSSTLAAFSVWAFGTASTPGGQVSVTIPPGYRVAVQGGPLTAAATDPSGQQVLGAGPLSKPLTFAAYVVADRPGAYRETPVLVTVAGRPVTIVVRAWPDDPAFGSRVATLLRRAMPILGDLIGIPVPHGSGTGGTAAAGPVLAVEETATRASGGYSAAFDAATRTMQIAYNASPGVILREAAHAWFNPALVGDAWAAEGFAAYYAGQAAGPLKIALALPSLTPKMTPDRIALNSWVVGGSPDADGTADGGATIDGAGSSGAGSSGAGSSGAGSSGAGSADGGAAKADAYARAASLTLATLIAERAGPARLTSVWEAAARGEMADQPAHGGAAETQPPGTAVGAPDWRGLLDLLETRTGRSFDDLWRSWVIRSDEVPLLDARSIARTSYAAAVREAGSWELPPAIRTALDAWQFDQAGELIADARAAVARLPSLRSAAAAADLTLPVKLRVIFESDAGPAAASEAAAEEATIARIVADATTRPVEPDPVTTIGLLGSDPDAMLEVARAAFEAGDLGGAADAADAAAATWTGALDAGRQRLTLLGCAFGAFGLIVLLAARRRDPRRAAAPAATASAARAQAGEHDAGSSSGAGYPGLVRPYGTLARTLQAGSAAKPHRARPSRTAPAGERPAGGQSAGGGQPAGESDAGSPRGDDR